MRYLLLLSLVTGCVGAQSISVLSQSQIQDLETTAARNPADLASQTLLGENYSFVILGITALGQNNTVAGLDPAKARSEFAQHARDVMQNSLSAGILGEGGEALWNFSFQVQGYEGRHQLGAQVDYLDARALGARALDQAIAIEPGNGTWRSYRIPILVLRSDSDFLPLSATDAYRLVKEDLSVLTGTARYLMLAYAGKLAVNASALDDAERDAIELLNDAIDPADWSYGNAVFFGNMIRGQVALRRGGVAAARSWLLSSGHTPGSPQLDSFGPNMSLARDLLTGVAAIPGGDRRAVPPARRKATSPDARETVLEFLDLCRAFWTLDQGRLQQWSEQVREGLVPDFGPNLNY